MDDVLCNTDKRYIYTNKRNIVLEKLQTLAKSKGYLTFNDILDMSEEFNIEIDDIDRIAENLLSMGTIITKTDKNAYHHEEKITDDRSRIDYNLIYDKVLELDSALEPYINFIKTVPPPAIKEVESLIFQAQDGNRYAFDRIVYMYSKIVISIALSFSQKLNLPIADTIQSGTIGLINAIKKYDPSREGGFTTYAPWWIRQYIERSAPTINTLLYYPAQIKYKMFLIYDMVLDHICALCPRYGLCPNLISQVEIKLECDSKEAIWYLEQFEKFISVEQYIEDDEDFFQDNNLYENIMIEDIERSIIREKISDVLLQLKDREREVIEKRFGFKNNIEMTLEEVGYDFKVTRERIRQIEAKAIRRLRHPSRIKYLRYF